MFSRAEENYGGLYSWAVKSSCWRPVVFAEFCSARGVPHLGASGVWRLSVVLPFAMCFRSCSRRCGRKAWLGCPAAWSARTPRFYAPAVAWDCVSRAWTERECARGTLTNSAEMCATLVSRALLHGQRHFDSGKHFFFAFPRSPRVYFLFLYCINVT